LVDIPLTHKLDKNGIYGKNAWVQHLFAEQIFFQIGDG